LLVHGPLTLVLMLSVLRRQLGKGEEVESFSYRNLAPLYACEEMRVCLKRDREKTRIFDVWIEGSLGGYAVKGTAVISKSDIDPDINTAGDSEILTPHPTVY
jgi:hydroxyacyl-ACP dehydratase HTD2-like protein with hotdog domain